MLSEGSEYKLVPATGVTVVSARGHFTCVAKNTIAWLINPFSSAVVKSELAVVWVICTSDCALISARVAIMRPFSYGAETAHPAPSAPLSAPARAHAPLPAIFARRRIQFLWRD